ncbi:Acryloyl-CoA reductase (NADH) [Rhodobacteraceae bacterium THAF1]|uniref:acyl-CoA dehydrogenase family protein n=1 Tax=Palleronia sp. THAF1 TaxID=2587842 RepID=UPI000F3FF4E3|nr:acyl-CoA dehydrogenase [Palleronia sp. THAF1]QFU08009.1 Acryloyl-CoA reductase (NADH) [Palleronia sp. THAF1]VDC27862.1 Acryloyl-CoA reductase (NADH) [Rhodobacteraceae bacterium THAF1]
MNFEHTEERTMLSDGLRRLLGDVTDLKALARGDYGWSTDAWEKLAEMGVIGALFSEEDGGFGGAGFDLMVTFEEMGRAGAPEPLLEVVLAGGLIAALGADSQKEAIEAIIAGTTQVAFAHGEPGSRYDLARVSTQAEKTDDGWKLSGRKSVVTNGAEADLLVVSARTSGEVGDTDGISLFLVPKGTDGLDLRDYPLAGGGRGAEIEMTDVTLPADALLGEEGKAFEAIETANARATCALCAEALGLMETAKKLTMDYLGQRNQFGQPIGRFQALQFRMADMIVEVEQARSAVINLAGHLDDDRKDREIHVSATKQLVGQTVKMVVEESIQMHGGIGMTMEYDLGHFARRATMTEHRLGDALYHLGRFSRLRGAA